MSDIGKITIQVDTTEVDDALMKLERHVTTWTGPTYADCRDDQVLFTGAQVRSIIEAIASSRGMAAGE